MADPTAPTPDQQARALYEQAESRTADAFEDLVSRPSFGVLLAHTAENIAALTRISADMADAVLRNLRIAGRADVVRLARQLQRTEDKLERVLQEVEELRDELARERSADGPAGAAANAGSRQAREAANGSAGAEANSAPRRTRKTS